MPLNQKNKKKYLNHQQTPTGLSKKVPYIQPVPIKLPTPNNPLFYDISLPVFPKTFPYCLY